MATLSTDNIHAFMNAAGECMLVMLESASFIREELPNVTMDDNLRAKVQDICSTLVGTKHDVSNEIDRIDELLNDRAPDESILLRVEWIISWIGKDLLKLHDAVTALKAAEKNDLKSGLAYMLVAESATNILYAFNEMHAAAERVKVQL